MKKLFTILASAFLLATFPSCEKCATCTSISEDPLTEGDELIDEVCGTGRDYDDQLEIYTRSGWDCSEN